MFCGELVKCHRPPNFSGGAVATMVSKISVFSPYGSYGEEVGTLTLFSYFIRDMFLGVYPLACNGAFSLCERDNEIIGERTIRNCMSCLKEQKVHHNSIGAAAIEISSLLRPRDIRETHEWVLSLATADLAGAVYGGMQVGDILERVYRRRGANFSLFDVAQDDETLVRRGLLIVARVMEASKRFISIYSPDLILVARGDDILTRPFVQMARALGAKVSTFRWDLGVRSVLVSHPSHETYWRCEIVLPATTNKPELPKLVEQHQAQLIDLARFLGLATEQLTLL